MKECQECKELLDRASEATTRHLEAIGRLQIATIRQEREDIQALEQAVAEARTVRIEAITACQAHERSHRTVEATAE